MCITLGLRPWGRLEGMTVARSGLARLLPSVLPWRDSRGPPQMGRVWWFGQQAWKVLGRGVVRVAQGTRRPDVALGHK